MYTAMTVPATRLRMLATAKAFQGISLIKIPAMLHSAAQHSISSMALFSFVIRITKRAFYENGACFARPIHE